MEQVQAKGDALVTFDGRFVTLSRSGARGVLGGKGDRRIPLSSITMVNWKAPGPLMKGYVHFATAGSPASSSKAGSTAKMTNNADAAFFSKRQAGDFAALRDAVEDALAAREG